MLDKATVSKIANLARIKLSKDETERLANELTNIFDWVEKLNEVNTNSITPMTSVIDMAMPSRVDQVDDGNDADRVLQNAPDRPDNGQKYYSVPKVID